MRFPLTLLLLLSVVGCGTPSFLITPVANTNRLQEETVEEGKGWSPRKIAIIEVEGMLLNARGGGFLQPTENPLSRFVQQLKAAEEDPAVRAVVLRVNSPGGTVTASDTMYQALREFRQKTGKPIIASTQEVAASGGYYVCCAADRIIAQPTSVVGSVGVIFYAFDASGTMNKIGLRSESIKSGQFKDMGWPLKPLGSEERALMQQMVDEYHERFIAIVAQRMKAADEQVLNLVSDGRVFSGAKAHQLGLVDELGTLPQAIEAARSMANVPGAKVVMYRRPYGYGGTIYADSSAPRPRADVMQLSVPGMRDLLPTGFYYLWNP